MEKVAKLDTEKKLTRIGNYSMTGKTLGKGHFAHVLEGYHMLLKVKAAIKIINTQDITDVYVKKNLKRETKIMSKISHPNIVFLFETIETKRHYYIITELCSGGDLCNFVKSQVYGKLGEKQARFFARQLVLAVAHLHSRGIVHRDLKMENILLDTGKKRVKIVDFGLSNFYNQQDPLKTHCGSPEYAAPELYVSGKRYGPEVDIWSLGIIFYGMLVGRLPFQTWQKAGLTQSEKRKHLMIETKNGLTLKHHKHLMDASYIFRNLINQMLKPDSCERISMHELQINSWIAETPYMKIIEEYPNEDRQWKRNIIAKVADCMHISYNEAYEKTTDIPYGPLGGIYNMEKFVHLNNRIGVGNIREIKTTDKAVVRLNKDDSKPVTSTMTSVATTIPTKRSSSKTILSHFSSKTKIKIGTRRPIKIIKATAIVEKHNQILQNNDIYPKGMKCDTTSSNEKLSQPPNSHDIHYNLVRKKQTMMKSSANLGPPLPIIKAAPKTYLNERFSFSLHSRFPNENNNNNNNNNYSPHNNNANYKIKTYLKATKDKNNEIEKKSIINNINNNIKNNIYPKYDQLESIYLNKRLNLNSSNSKTNSNSNSNTVNYNENLNKNNNNKINLKNKNNSTINNKKTEGILKYLFPFKSKELNSTKFSKISNSSNINLSSGKKSSGVTLMRNSINSNINMDNDKNKGKKLKKR